MSAVANQRLALRWVLWQDNGTVAGVLVLEGETPDNQHDVEVRRGEQESVTKGQGAVMVARGGCTFG